MSYYIGQTVELKSGMIVTITQIDRYHVKVISENYSGPFKVNMSEIITKSRQDKLDLI